MVEPLHIQVRFFDCDMLQHVNNAVYLNYFEEARIHYFRELLGADWDWKTHGVLLRKNELEYIKPVFLNDDVTIQISTQHIGNKSFTLYYELTVNGDLRTTGSSILVCYNNQTHESILIPEQMKIALQLMISKTEQKL